MIDFLVARCGANDQVRPGFVNSMHFACKDNMLAIAQCAMSCRHCLHTMLLVLQAATAGDCAVMAEAAACVCLLTGVLDHMHQLILTIACTCVTGTSDQISRSFLLSTTTSTSQSSEIILIYICSVYHNCWRSSLSSP